jgi:hypothetical protein
VLGVQYKLMCICNGNLGFYSEDNGQFISYLNCEAGRARHKQERDNIEAARIICERRLEELRKELNKKWANDY